MSTTPAWLLHNVYHRLVCYFSETSMAEEQESYWSLSFQFDTSEDPFQHQMRLMHHTRNALEIGKSPREVTSKRYIFRQTIRVFCLESSRILKWNCAFTAKSREVSMRQRIIWLVLIQTRLMAFVQSKFSLSWIKLTKFNFLCHIGP